ncbi:hypothetical protein N7931_15080 [Catenovulum sp. 2E275]|uniref:hypothetical protein n=1 Tax=Catenovulum sp. 2E275 TaxID=2980497 RepID=UPI0021CE0806|nr:hypothetical protein [Catenovulum sp. 2E275]MCU4676956.1 hypothetical protein [Catenovulum sp. 2E275]
MRNKHLFTGIACIATTMFCELAMANPDVTSREYKRLLDPTLFTYNTESTKVANYFSAFETVVEAAISRDVTGSLSLDKVRTVKFFDTSGSCQLNALGYVFRERIENGNSEVTLKFRSQDRYISDFEDLSSATSGAETKLEADWGINSAGYKIVYGHSTKAPNTRTINDFKDINTHYPGFENDYGFNDNLALDLVGNLTIHERVYKGAEIDLGSIDAEVSITLWYTSSPSGSQSPFIAEASFKYEDPSADYTQKVVKRAKAAFDSLLTLDSWNELGSTTKTQSVYQYNSNFCN